MAGVVVDVAGATSPRREIVGGIDPDAERLIVRVRDTESIGESILPYVNRLSDALFVMSRHATRLYGEPEPLWEPEKT